MIIVQLYTIILTWIQVLVDPFFWLPLWHVIDWNNIWSLLIWLITLFIFTIAIFQPALHVELWWPSYMFQVTIAIKSKMHSVKTCRVMHFFLYIKQVHESSQLKLTFRGKSAWCDSFCYNYHSQCLTKSFFFLFIISLYLLQTTHVAAQYGQTAFLFHVVTKWNADPDAPDNDGRSPLHWYVHICARLYLFFLYRHLVWMIKLFLWFWERMPDCF